MYVSALPLLAAGGEPPPPDLLSLELPHAAAPAASRAVQPNTANRCVRMFSAPLQWVRVVLRPPNLVDGQPAARRSCVETATRQRKPTSQTTLVVVGAFQHRMHAGEARELEAGVQREPVRARLEAGGG